MFLWRGQKVLPDPVSVSGTHHTPDRTEPSGPRATSVLVVNCLYLPYAYLSYNVISQLHAPTVQYQWKDRAVHEKYPSIDAKRHALKDRQRIVATLPIYPQLLCCVNDF